MRASSSKSSKSVVSFAMLKSMSVFIIFWQFCFSSEVSEIIKRNYFGCENFIVSQWVSSSQTDSTNELRFDVIPLTIYKEFYHK